jgi:hypothetical protein
VDHEVRGSRYRLRPWLASYASVAGQTVAQ